MDNLNSDLLRTFLAVAEAGSVTDGAARIFRSQSAASLQIKKLEDLIGQPVFQRHGRGVVLSAAGERLLPIAQDVTHRLDAALRMLRSDDIHGRLRLGIPDDQSMELLSRIIAEFAQSHPLVELDVTCATSTNFPEELACGALDLAIYEIATPLPDAKILRREQTSWIMSRHHDLMACDPVPVALFDRDCWWRDAALHSLRALGRPFKIVYSSQSVAGVAAAIEAGIAIGILGESHLKPALKPLGDAFGLGETPVSHLVLSRAGGLGTAAADAMETAIKNAFA